MESAVLDQVTIDIASGDKTVALRATGSVVRFNGFLTLYDEGRDDKAEDEDGNTILPDVAENEPLERREVIPEQHFTEPPPRYSEASLVKKLEELGIGRPSTYASIIDVLQRRNYVRLDRKRFVPEDRGRIVTAFLQTYFPRYVEYNFTAHLEEELDEISDGRIDWRQVLRQVWREFSAAVGETKELRVSEVLDKLDDELGPHFFPANDNGGKSPRECPSCGNGRLGLKLGKFGAFIGCSNYPECRFTRKLGIVDAEADATSGANLDKPKLLGIDPETGKEVTLRNGPYGLYVQLGEPEGKEKPKRQSLLRGMAPDDLTLEKALALLSLPRELGPHPDDGEPIVAGVGRFGPYVKHGSKYKSIPIDESVLDIGMNRAVALLAEAKQTRGRAAAKPVRVVGNHPSDDQPIELYEGRYGPYVKHGGINATVPRDIKPEDLTVDQAIALLAERAAKGGGKKSKAPRAKKAAPAPANDLGEKPAPKKAGAKKKKAAPKRKAKTETPSRTGTDG
jgi:DNA topoisomerase-1